MRRAVTAILLCILLGLPLPPGCAETAAGDPQLTLMGKTLTYQGAVYRLRKRITTILVMGIDQWDEETPGADTYRRAGQADFQAVIVIDDNAQTVSLLQIDRNTMAPMTVLNLLGQPIGERTAQICLAYSYGDGGAISGRMAKSACSAYLLDTPIDHYYAVTLDGIGVFNDLLGGIEVTLEDDFSAYDPAMIPGETVTLAGKQAEYYLRGRYYVGDGSNASRMRRQKDYLEKAKDALDRQMEADPSFILDLFDALSPFANTDMRRGLILNLANKADRYAFLPIREIEGERQIGEGGYEEFRADEASLHQAVLEQFYEPL